MLDLSADAQCTRISYSNPFISANPPTYSSALKWHHFVLWFSIFSQQSNARLNSCMH